MIGDDKQPPGTYFGPRPSLPCVNLQEGCVSGQTDVLQGTLDLLILGTIAPEPMHGWAIAQRIQQMSNDLLRVQQGSLYPALHRLEHQGWIKAEWGASENNRRARFYSLTRAGRKQLALEVSKWERLSAGVNLVLQGTQIHASLA
jgi:transcriptional regulator